MQPYYNQPAGPPGAMGMMGGGGMGMGGMNPMQLQQMQQMGGVGGMGMPGMGGMGMGGMNGMNGMNGMGGMGGGMMQPGMGMGGQGFGQAWKQLGYDYRLPEISYTPDANWGAWDLATARYGGSRMERGFFDNLMDTLGNFFPHRHLSDDAARNAHRRVYYGNEGADAGNKTLGGAAAYQAWLLWDRDHHSVYHQYPSQENLQRLIGLAIGEIYNMWETVQPRGSKADPNEAAQYAAATAKYLYERHYNLKDGSMGNVRDMMRGGRFSGYGADDDSDSGSEGRRMRRRSMYGGRMGGMPGMSGMGGMNPMMQGQGGMMPNPGFGMSTPGYGAMGMPGAMANQMGLMGGGGPMGQGMGMMNPMMQNGMMGGMMPQGSMNPMMMMQGGYGNPNNEAQAGPGMHPYHFGAQSGVAYGNQPIDQMGQPTFPGGPGRTWYGYGQPRQF